MFIIGPIWLIFMIYMIGSIFNHPSKEERWLSKRAAQERKNHIRQMIQSESIQREQISKPIVLAINIVGLLVISSAIVAVLHG